MAESSSSASSRRPNPSYRNQKGFSEHIDRQLSGVGTSKINLHAVAANPTGASKGEMREFRDAIQRRQFVEDMMELKGTFFAGLDAIKQANEAPESSATLGEHIQELRQKHIEEVRTLYQWHAQDYYDEVLNMSRNRPDHCEDDNVDAFYQVSRLGHDIAVSFDDDLDRHHHAHLEAVHPLLKERAVIRNREDIEQMRRDQVFPSSVAELRAISSKEVQKRIARFLSSDEMARERTMDEFKWAYRQVNPLVSEYNSNDDFKSEIHSLLREVEVRDPRKARQNP